ncbi:MAG TPA: zf-HC2 domain-containing protein [Actinomycetota bacterium]|nr:zf-HC2 domain-containing protein [Actinomycetota bacterium]
MNEHIRSEVMSAIVDGESTAEERRTADVHLQGCAECRRALSELSSVRDLVSALPRLEAPEEVVQAALRPGRVRLLSPRRRLVALAAAAAVVVSLAGVVRPPEPEAEPPVDAFVARHVGVSAGNQSAGEVLFAVPGR